MNRYRSPVKKIACLLLTLSLLGTACSASDNAASLTASEDSEAAETVSGDAEMSIIAEPEEAMYDEPEAAISDDAEEAMYDEPEAAISDDAEEAMSDDAEAAISDVATADATSAEGTEAGSRGLFSSDSEPEPEPKRRDAEQQRADRLADNRFADYGYREFIETDVDPVSTFALDVDTGSYTIARRWLDEGILPPPEAVRVEEFVNAFDYDYDAPRRGLELSVDGGPSPFDDDNYLVRVGVQAEEVAAEDRPPASLTFVVDTSGSMDRDDRLGLVKDSLEILVDELNDDDTVAIVVYSDGAGVILEPTEVRDSRRIYDAIDSLQPGGSTNLESGLREGYALANASFREDGINRVIIASDGVANAGVTDDDYLARIIQDDIYDGIQLVTIGYGMGNYNDVTMEQLADNGNGFYAYVDTEDEAERLFEDELTSTLVTAAIDAKIQVVFDPDVVDEYRLIGYENRGVLDRDFTNDAVDAGELGAGHQVTAVYEVDLRRGVDLDDRGEIGEVFLRWQDPDDGDVIEIDEDIDLRDVAETFGETSDHFQLATVVTAFAEVLRDNPYADRVDLDNVFNEAERVAGRIDTDETDELVDLIERARILR